MNNPKIHINDNLSFAPSLKELAASYSGKVVYIDLWGTWCYPCMQEIQYMPALKAHFKDSDLVCLYIDRDEDKDDERWKDYVYIHNITGEHVRMTGAQIDQIWNELAPGSPKQSYPRYCILDKNGNLVVDDAKRPSSGENLYDQISSVLGK